MSGSVPAEAASATAVAALTIWAARGGAGSWALVPKMSRVDAVTAILRAELDGWAGVPRQLRKRAELAARCGTGWQRRFAALRRDAHVSLAELARGDVS